MSKHLPSETVTKSPKKYFQVPNHIQFLLNSPLPTSVALRKKFNLQSFICFCFCNIMNIYQTYKPYTIVGPTVTRSWCITPREWNMFAFVYVENKQFSILKTHVFFVSFEAPIQPLKVCGENLRFNFLLNFICLDERLD